MPSRFTKVWLLWLVLLVSACAGVPGGKGKPGVDAATSPQTAPDQPDKIEAPRAALGPAVVVKVPPLRGGNQALFERAVQLLRDNKVEAAQVLLLELTEDQPELAGPWVNLAYTYLLAEDDVAAQQALQKALSANDKNCDALNQLGVLARRQGDFAGAEAYYKRCIAAQPGYADAYLNLGILYELYMGRLGEALAAYNDFQVAMPEPDLRVSGWVLDLERRVGAIAQR